MAKKDRYARITMRFPGTIALWISLFVSLFTSGLSADTAGPQSQSIGPTPPQLNVGFSTDKFADTDPRDAKAALMVWINMIAKKTPRILEKVGMLTYPDLTSIVKAGKEKQIDLLFLTSDEYFEMKGSMLFEPVVTTTPLGGKTIQFDILVRRDRGILQLGGLKSKSLLAEKGENHRLLSLWLETMIMKEGSTGLADFFPKLKEVTGTSRAVLAVFFGQADSCAAYRASFQTMKEMNPQLGKELIPIATSPGYVRGIVCLRVDVLDKFKWLVEEMISINNEPQGKQILTLMKIGKLIPFHADHLATTEALQREHRFLRMNLAKSGG